MIVIETQLVGGEQLLTAFSRIEHIFDDLSPVFEKLGDEFFPMVRQRFEQQGPGWQPLSEKYAKRKAALYGSSSILRATDALYESFKKGGTDSISRIGSREAEFGSGDFKGFLHQTGAGRLPVRTIIEITNEQESRFVRVAVDVLNQEIRAIGFETN